MSHTVIAEFECNPGKGKEFLETLVAALPDTRAFEGCELVEVYTNAENPDHVVLYEKWAKREDHGAYMSWRTSTGMMEATAPFMSGTPRITHLDSVDG